jgi:rhamnosyl/mannosyltransferase
MRVLQVYKDFYPPVCGGIERHLHDLVTGLPPLGVHCDVLVAAHVWRSSEELFSIHGNGAAPARLVKVGEWGRVLSAPLAPGFATRLRRLAPQYDLLHFHFPNPTAEIAWLLAGARTPYVVTYHSDIVRQRASAQFYRPLQERFLSRAARILVPSPQLLASSPHLPALKARCAVVPFGVDLASFEATPQIRRASAEVRGRIAGGDARAVVFLFAGKFRYYKGLPVLLEALARVRARGPDARLLLVGEGPEEKSLRARAVRLALAQHVHFLPHTSDAGLVACYHAADVFVLPSVARSEAFGLVLLEAMACGKPEISTELGTATSWVNENGRTGLVVAPGDVAALAAALELLAQDAELRARFGAAGRERVRQHFPRRRMLEAVREQYFYALEKPHAATRAEKERASFVAPGP